MKRNVRPIIGFLFMAMAACNNKQEKTTEPITTNTHQLVFDKLVGIWRSEDGKNFEQWTKNENGTFESRAFSIKAPDTSWDYHAKIYPENSNWVFENTVKGQNEGKAVKFTSIILTETTVQFSNPQHDFPTDINYSVPHVNTVNAFIIGPNTKGGKDTVPFNYTRIK